MANSVIVKLQLQDELSPELKKSQTELENLAKEILDLDKNLKTLKADKTGIMKGSIKSDIDSVNQLQKELIALRKEREKASKNTTKREADDKILKKEKELRDEIRNSIEKQTAALEKQKVALKKSSNEVDEALKKELRSRKKVTESIHSETAAMKTNSTSRMKENAERRALGTTLVRHIRRLESMAVAYFALTRAYDATLGAGIKLNREYENMELGLAAIIASKTQAISVQEKEVSALAKFNAAQELTKTLMDDIKTASLKTPATFQQMTGFFQQAIGHSLSSGDAFGETISEINQNTIQLTQRMSNLGGAVGMQMDRVNEEIRSLMSGNASTDSLLASILFGSPADANKAIKEAKKKTNGLTDLMNETFKDFKPVEDIKTYDKVMNALLQQVDNIRKEMSKPLFNDIQNQAEKFTKYLLENSDEIVESIKSIYEGVKIAAEAALTLAKAFVAYKALSLTSSFLESTKAVKRFQKGIVLATISQRAFNLAASVNPYILLATAAVTYYSLVSNKIDDINEKIEKSNEKYGKMIQGHYEDGILKQVTELENKKLQAYENYKKAQSILGDSKSTDFYKSEYEKAEKHYNEVKQRAIEINNERLNDWQKKNTLKAKLQTVNKKGSKPSSTPDESGLMKIAIEMRNAYNKKIQDEIDLNSKLRDVYFEMTGSDYDVWLMKASKQMEELAKSTELTADEYQNFWDLLQLSSENPIATELSDAIKQAQETASEPLNFKKGLKIVPESKELENFMNKMEQGFADALSQAFLSGDVEGATKNIAIMLGAELGKAAGGAIGGPAGAAVGEVAGGVLGNYIAEAFGSKDYLSGFDHATNAMEDFTKGINNAVNALEVFGNVGTSIEMQINETQADLDYYLGHQASQEDKTFSYNIRSSKVTDRKASFDDRTFRGSTSSSVRNKIQSYTDEMVSSLDESLREIRAEFVSGQLDWSVKSVDEINVVLSEQNVDVEAFKEAEIALNNLAIQIKGLEVGSKEYKAALATVNQETYDAYFNALDYADAIKIVDEASQEMIDSIQESVENVFNAWSGSLSYLTLQQKSLLADGYYELSQVEGSSINAVDAALAKAEAAYKTAKTREEYIPAFDNYINELKNEAPENTLDDVVGRLDTLIDRVEELEETERMKSA